MPRRPAHRLHYAADIRAWFGLTLNDLADYLGVSKQFLGKVETGQRPLSLALSRTLLPLLLQLPPPEVQAAAAALAALETELPPLPPVPVPATPPPLPAPDARALDVRRRTCLAQAARAQAERARLAQQARVAARWAAALPALLPPGADAPDAPATTGDDPDGTAARRRWLGLWLRRRAQPLPPAAATRYYYLGARVAGLLAEAAALSA